MPSSTGHGFCSQTYRNQYWHTGGGKVCYHTCVQCSFYCEWLLNVCPKTRQNSNLMQCQVSLHELKLLKAGSHFLALSLSLSACLSTISSSVSCTLTQNDSIQHSFCRNCNCPLLRAPDYIHSMTFRFERVTALWSYFFAHCCLFSN